MDFIKTSSLRALIELTFQRNWNGLIWMSRKGVITKRVKTVQTALSRKRPTAQSGWPRNDVPRSAKLQPSKSGRAHVRPGKQVPRSAKHNHPPRARPCRASREVTPRGRATSRVPRPMHPSEPGKPSHVRPRIHRPNLHPPTTAADHESVRPRPFRLGHDHDPIRPIVPTDRPNAAVDPKPVLKPFHYFQARLNPKPPLKDLALYIYF
ncbi:unnamed protein product [Microthlaspi erraticum]|uniref:Uncharacterized protein n=1 Tax=Microthlaspi erraticum TaxID=1685480 RepID=A0A6D2KHD4_9BRAS|nr:unnamed protein product [Microthlaspi erraticum]